MSTLRTAKRYLRIVLFGGSVVAAAGAGAFAAEPGEVQVATLAGSGLSRAIDGPAARSAFVMPAGIAVAADDTIYISDIGAQTIRRYSHGTVVTVAGATVPGSTGDQARGGYLDGPAAKARFSRPEGLAVGRDGQIYIADTLNHCIRVLQRGIVSTFAGSPHAGSADGTGTHAQFGLPKGVAVDGDGNVYVADAYNGIRKITAGGVVTTLRLPMSPDKLVSSVAVSGHAPGVALAYSDTRNIYWVKGSEQKSEAYNSKNQPWDENETIGYSFAIAIVANDAVVVTDLAEDSVKYVRFSEPPFYPGSLKKSFAAGRTGYQWHIGGYRDGPESDAQLNAPLGIGRLADGTIVVADSGNRRIRTLTGIISKAFVHPDLSDLHFRPKSYRVMMIGDSNMLESVMWNDSMPGIVENRLRQEGPKYGLTREPDVEFTSTAGIGLHAAESFIDNDFADGEADLVIVFVDNFYLLNDPQLEPNDGWRSAVPAQFAALQTKLAASKTQLAFVVIPPGQAVSPSEHLREVEMQIDPAAYDYDLSYRTAASFEHVFDASGVHCVDLLDPMRVADERPSPVALFNDMDHHMTPEGGAWIANYAADDLERWAPWTR